MSGNLAQVDRIQLVFRALGRFYFTDPDSLLPEVVDTSRADVEADSSVLNNCKFTKELLYGDVWDNYLRQRVFGALHNEPPDKLDASLVRGACFGLSVVAQSMGVEGAKRLIANCEYSLEKAIKNNHDVTLPTAPTNDSAVVELQDGLNSVSNR